MANNDQISWHQDGYISNPESINDVQTQEEWQQTPIDIESSSFTDFRALMAKQRSLLPGGGDSNDGTVEGDFFTLCVGVDTYPYIYSLTLLFYVQPAGIMEAFILFLCVMISWKRLLEPKEHGQ